jgi:hypothetical protein
MLLDQEAMEMSLVVNQKVTLLLPEEQDAKGVVSKYRAIYLTGCRVEPATSKELSDLGLTDTSGVTLYHIFKYGKATDINNNRLNYISWPQYEQLDESGRLEYWSVNDSNCCVIEGFIDTENKNSFKDFSSIYRLYIIRSVRPLYGGNGLHHLEITGV